MGEKSVSGTAQEKKFVAEQVWLHYYNDYLFQKGMITETQRGKMRFMIDSRKPSANHRGPQ